MRRPSISILALVGALILGHSRSEAAADENQGDGGKALSADEELEILAGQHVVYSYPNSSAPPEELLRLTRAGLVGGVVLFRENVDNGTAEAMKALKAAYAISPAPALLRAKADLGDAGVGFIVAVDQEGGQVRRFTDVAAGDGPEQSAKEIGAAPDPGQAGAEAGRQAAETLLRHGANVNLAPVLDVFRSPGDFSDGFKRSFGNTSARVVAAAVPFLDAQQAAGVAATVKHFPGLGAAPAGANTDDESVTLDLSAEELRTVDMAPYGDALAAGVDLVMTSWAVYPALDPELPAGLSGRCVRDELRERLGFRGVTVTDALEAGSLAAFGDTAAVAVLAARAGMDLLLASSRDVGQGDAVRRALVQALRDGELDSRDFEDATRRIAVLRSNLTVE
ncbi:hypothetical protein CDD83_1602 [Cordyceps sp. RAO-2017]|nr:hypothetical protein CDD83_1602 [Cordyceps sp. RAO-2017]